MCTRPISECPEIWRNGNLETLWRNGNWQCKIKITLLLNLSKKLIFPRKPVMPSELKFIVLFLCFVLILSTSEMCHFVPDPYKNKKLFFNLKCILSNLSVQNLTMIFNKSISTIIQQLLIVSIIPTCQSAYLIALFLISLRQPRLSKDILHMETHKTHKTNCYKFPASLQRIDRRKL